ncbi:MAG TPA: EAL domain-containing protein [Allosphingosinicella sp.]|nr:EAL domain-containing protein [Allosphingosinicella sp.]
MGKLKAWLAGLADVGEADTLTGRSILEERYRALQRQIPLLYAIALANFMGLHLATTGFTSFLSPSSLLALLIVARLIYWVRNRRRTLPPERILRELKRTFFFALAFCVGFVAWGIYLSLAGGPETKAYVILFASMASIGCAYGLSSFPSAARLPIVVLGIPMVLMLLTEPDPVLVTIGFSLCVILLITLRLLGIHNENFTQLVESRAGIAAERERARRAEKTAKAEKAKARIVADTDPLTRLANRRAFLRTLGREAGSLRRSGLSFALAMVDLDGFKPINDTFGHATGDSVLMEVGARLATAGGAGALVARTGGDEFALLLRGCEDRDSAALAGRKICDLLSQPFTIDGREFRISGSCGLTMLAPGDCSVTRALIRGDTALYRAKQQGRAGVAVFSSDMEEIQQRRIRIEEALRRIETRGTIGLQFQPIVELSSGRLRAFEALARWHDEALGDVSPAEFIPIAEQIGVIAGISDDLLAAAAREACNWPDSVRLSFNLSAVQLCTVGSAARILYILAGNGMSPDRLQIEVTETALLVDFHVARDNLDDLRRAGARIVLDDFGAGHASISYLREMQFDGIKLDGSLIAPPSDTVRGRRLLKGVLDLCASLGLPCVAEHIETRPQLALLGELGCRDGQGFLLSPPLDAEAAATLAASSVTELKSNTRAA